MKLTPATRSRDVTFNQLEEGTGARIRYRRVSEQTGAEVPNDRIVRAFEISKGHYVVVEKDELAALAPKATRTIEIEDFVDLDEIDPIYFDQPYYVLPDKGAEKPYRLLAEAMTGLRKVAVGRVVIRAKEHLVAIRPVDGVLCVETMRYADEIVPLAELGGARGEDVEVSEKELAMARQLIDSLSADWAVTKYRDEYREELLALIDRKAAGEEIVAQPTIEPKAKVLDLMAALEASLERAGKGKSARKTEVRAPKPAKKTATKTATKSGGKKASGAKKSTRSRRSA